jgi:hypothetical protein
MAFKDDEKSMEDAEWGRPTDTPRVGEGGGYWK